MTVLFYNDFFSLADTLTADSSSAVIENCCDCPTFLKFSLQLNENVRKQLRNFEHYFEYIIVVSVLVVVINTEYSFHDYSSIGYGQKARRKIKSSL